MREPIKNTTMSGGLSSSLVAWAAITGALGDATLQVLVKNGIGSGGSWGLKEYFAQHGTGEAICVAAGMMALFFVIWVGILAPLLRIQPTNLVAVAVYGVVLDLLFRRFRIFESLDGYYASLNYFWSGFWAAIPMIIPVILARKFSGYR